MTAAVPPEGPTGTRHIAVSDRMPEHWRRVEAIKRYAAGECDPAARCPDVHEISDVGGTWLERLIWRRVEVKEQGAKEHRCLPKACLANVHTILLHDARWRGVLAYDEFVEAAVKTRMPPWPHPLGATPDGEWSEADADRLRCWVDHAYGFTIAAPDALHTAAVIAAANKIHPLRDYLHKASLKWDRVQRLPTILPRYFGAEDTAYTRGVGARWFVSAVARAFRPGCQADCTLILESGKQGWRKSSAFRALVPWDGLYSESGVTIGDKDSYQALRGIWIFGFDELASLRRSDVVKVRTFLTAVRDRYRPSYGRRVLAFPRQCVFVGTTNEYEYLVDPAGNRRFLPVRLERPADDAALARDRDQIWAEAYVRFASNEAWWVDSDELRALCEAEQSARVVPDEWVGLIGQWLADPRDSNGRPVDCSDGVLLLDVLNHAIGMRTSDAGKGEQARAADAMRVIGYERGTQRRRGDARIRLWTPTHR